MTDVTIPNTDTLNGVAYGLVRLNDLPSAIADELWSSSEEADYESARDAWGREYALACGWIEDDEELSYSDVGIDCPLDPDEYEDDEWEEAINEFARENGYPSDYFMEWDEWLDEYHPGWQCLYEGDSGASREGVLEEVSYALSMFAGAWMVIVEKSPFIAPRQDCGPCLPNAHNISPRDAIEPLTLLGAEGSESIHDKGYTVPPDWWVEE